MDNREKMLSSLQKELAILEKKEKKLEEAALRAREPKLKTRLESKIPEKIYSGVESAFGKGFALVFDQGRGIIEKSYSRETLSADHRIRDYALLVKGSRRELRRMRGRARKSDLLNLTVTAVEGIGLGALGIGLPDIVIFIGALLKGVYETALNYGFSYESRDEQYLILKMMEVSLSTGDDWQRGNIEVDNIFRKRNDDVSEEDFKAQLEKTASAFAMDMLLLKFIQSMPVVGLVAGASNPVYYNKVLQYVSLKYQKHYMINKLYESKELMKI